MQMVCVPSTVMFAPMNRVRVEKSRREENTEATRHALLAAGREIFAREGFEAAGMEAISRAARVTRGAFYHHFADKRALFDAVIVALQTEAAETIKARALTERKLRDRLSAGIDAFLDVCLEPVYARLVVQEAPAVLGQQRFREIEEMHPMALLLANLSALKRDGEIVFDDIVLLGRMLDAMICKLSLMLAEADDPKKLRRQGHKIIDRLLEGFRKG